MNLFLKTVPKLFDPQSVQTNHSQLVIVFCWHSLWNIDFDWLSWRAFRLVNNVYTAMFKWITESQLKQQKITKGNASAVEQLTGMLFKIKKHLYPCFISLIKYGYEFGCVWIKSREHQHKWFNYTHQNEFPWFITRVQMFYFDSNTTIPLQCAALVFLESVCWQDVVWLTFPWDSNKISY